FGFEGIGFVLKGDISRWDNNSGYIFNTELWVDGKLMGTPKLPVSYTTRRYDLAWMYGLPKGKHTVKMKILNPAKDENIRASEAIIYSDSPVNGMQENINAAKKQ